jgi:ABC-type dipeptide/oligopeptide/nickel transport system ATPase component
MASVRPPLLQVEDLKISFGPKKGPGVSVVHGISFRIGQGECLAVVGESGSGKSVSAMALSRLLPEPPARITAKSMNINGKEILKLKRDELRKMRGREIAYIFQDPGTSLNPVFTIRTQMLEVIRLHRPNLIDPEGEIIRWLHLVGIVDCVKRLDDYPWQFSGGMQQRVMIAMALCGRPDLLIADEPTTALDVTLQRQIMQLLAKLKNDLGLGVMLITHNFGIIRDIADRVAVMFRGNLVEEGPVEQILTNPQHAYTKALIACVPSINKTLDRLPTVDQAMASSEA